MKRQIEMKVINPLLDRYGLPDYQTPGSAALDLVACIDTEKEIPAGENVLIGSGIAVNIQDPGLVAVVASRSGLCLKHRIRVAQGMGVVDSDYHGEISVILQNDSSKSYVVQPGDRIAQLLFMPVVQVGLKQVGEFTTQTERGAGGFGSTGK